MNDFKVGNMVRLVKNDHLVSILNDPPKTGDTGEVRAIDYPAIQVAFEVGVYWVLLESLAPAIDLKIGDRVIITDDIRFDGKGKYVGKTGVVYSIDDTDDSVEVHIDGGPGYYWVDAKGVQKIDLTLIKRSLPWTAAPTIPASMGISKDRSDFIEKLVTETTFSNLDDLIAGIFNDLRSVEEQAYFMFCFGQLIGRKSSRNDLFEALLG